MLKENVMWKFNLGDEVKSTITGFKGIIDARSEHYNGCKRYSVQPPVDKDGKMMDGYWCDEQSLELITSSKIKHKEVKTGGPQTKSLQQKNSY